MLIHYICTYISYTHTLHIALPILIHYLCLYTSYSYTLAILIHYVYVYTLPIFITVAILMSLAICRALAMLIHYIYL